ncbi:MAG: rRNA maturation RNase YbeY [Turneriella sp.]
MLRLLSSKAPQRFASQVRVFTRLLPAMEAALAATRWRHKPRGLKGRVVFDIQLVTDPQIARLNEAYRGKKGVTDVLSFSYIGGAIPAFAHETAGEVYISLPQAARQAKAEKHSLSDELAVLVIHGALHLMGYDHEMNAAEAERMRRLEARLVTNLTGHGVKAKGLIAR